jgi:ribosomal protein S18 acetylase RimI-like enzyme
LFSDVLGHLTAATETALTIETDRGPVVVPLTEVHLAKTVPARRRAVSARSSGAGAGAGAPTPAPTAREVLALERVAAAAWPPPELDHLGAWLLRAAEGWTNRGNSALALGDPGWPLPEAVDAVVDWYQARGLPPAITTPLPAMAAVARELDRRGWTPAPPTLVQTAPLPPPASGVDLAETPSEDWLAIVAGRKGGLPAAARHVLMADSMSAPRQVRFASVYADGLVAIARGVVDGEWLGLSLVEVLPPARRQGWARAVTGALAGWARDEGATRAYLQVEEHNEPAVALYADMGFTTHHRYVNYRAAQLIVAGA